MSDAPAISIITPTRDRLRLLREALDSVAAQTFHQWEHLVVDDGSEDGTAEEVQRREAEDPRVRYIRRQGEKGGANVCRNLGIQNSRAPLVVFLDSDDVLRPDCLARRVEAMGRNLDLDFAVFQAETFTRTVGDIGLPYCYVGPGDDLLRFLSHDCPWPISGPVWRRSFLTNVGCFDEDLLSMQDLEMHVRVLARQPRYQCFRHVDHDVRGENDPARTSTRHFKDPRYIEAAERVGEKLGSTVAEAGLLTWSRQRALAGLSFSAAQSWARAGFGRRALRAWTQGCRRNGAPTALWLVGIGMLILQAVDGSGDGVCARAVNKWKGWVRFRQEPELVRAVVSGTTA